jgi:DNA ligase 1
MPEILEGEIVEVQGSASKPYQLKNIGGVYSCSCPAWRNQSLPIDRRTCKHLRGHRGEAAEAARLGSSPPNAPLTGPSPIKAPPLLLAESWDGVSDPTGWLMSEKLDGVRAYWDGQRFLSRNGHVYHAPPEFKAGLPLEPLDGELWLGRKQFQKTVSIVRRQDQSEDWHRVLFVVFDAPAHDGPFEQRLEVVQQVMKVGWPYYAVAHPHHRCMSIGHLREELKRIEAEGGEGLMLRQPDAKYQTGRSMTLQKVKRFHDAEARVIGHDPGSGRHRGRLGALLVEMANGTRFAVGTGLSDAQRNRPPAIGTVINFRYQELTDGGVPRFPSFVGVREDVSLLSPLTTSGESLMASTIDKRRLQFSEGNSQKFWQISLNGSEVTVQFGKIGTTGQRQTKSFADAAQAREHAAEKISEKLRKGYVEVAAAWIC